MTAMFIATPPGRRVIRPGSSEESRIEVGERPITSHRTEPMQRISGVFMAEVLAWMGEGVKMGNLSGV